MKRMKSFFMTVLVAGTLFVPVMGLATDETDLEKVEKQLVQKETELLEPEMQLDKYLVERSKFDGMSGWFQGSKKKELERRIEEARTSIKSKNSEMVALQKQVQEVVFAVASTYEKKGDFKKAIEYYLKVEKQDDNVRFRIASCYKLLKEYEQAIQWFLKLSRTDQNLLEVVDCYKLDGRMKESIYWLFQILEPLNDNPAELTALQLIEEYKYPEKKRDYPDFPRRLSDVYVARAVMQCRADFSQARTSYEKASTLLADGGDVKTASWNILNRYQNDYKVALDILDQQRDAAERNYEDQLRRAKSEYDEAEQRYRRAQRDAEHEYASKLDDTRRELDRAEHDLRNLQGQASPSADLVAQARMRVEKTRNDYQYLVNNRTRFIDEYVRPYHRRMNEAMDSYRDIMNRRSEIIDRYIAPYKQKVAQAQDTLEKIRSLHESAYGR